MREAIGCHTSCQQQLLRRLSSRPGMPSRTAGPYRMIRTFEGGAGDVDQVPFCNGCG